MEKKPDIRFVLWSGKKFLYFGREDFRNKNGYGIVDIYGEDVSNDKDTMYLNILPVSCQTKIGIDGVASAILNFVAPDGKFNFRFQKNLFQQIEDRVKFFTSLRPATEKLNEILMARKNYRNTLRKKHILPYKSYYENCKIFDENYFNNPDAYSEQTFIFTPPQIIWIDMKQDDYDGWRRVFTGIVNNVSETDNPGKNRSITVTCMNLLQLTTRIPLMYEKTIVPFAESIFPSDDELFRIFYSTYMLSVFLDKKFCGFDVMAEVTFSELYQKLGTVINRSVGALSENDYKNLKETLKETDAKVFQPYKALTEKDIDTYQEICKEKSFYRFRLFCTKTVELYDGEDNLVSDKIGLKDLFQHDDDGWAVGKLKFNKIIKDLEQRDLDNKNKQLPRPFQKILQINLGSWYKPRFVMMSNIIRKFSTSYGFMSHTDGFGNWIVEYPNFNAMPKIGSNDERETIAYKDNDEKYVFQRFDYVSTNYMINPEKFVSFLELPFSYNVASLKAPEFIQDKFTGRSWGDIEQILHYGMNEVNMESLYFNVGSMGMDAREFLYKITDYFKERLNHEVWSVSSSHLLMPNIQVGRTAILIPQERKYFVSEVAHNIAVGRSGTTVLSLTHGRTLEENLTEPWKFFLDNVKEVLPISTSGNYKSLTTATDNMSSLSSKEISSVEYLNAHIKDVTGQELSNDNMEALIDAIRQNDMCPEPGSNVNFEGLDERIYLSIGMLAGLMKTWFQGNYTNVSTTKVVIWIGSAKRKHIDELKYDSRHESGRAVDISGVTWHFKRLTWGGAYIFESKDISFNADSPFGTPERDVPDGMFYNVIKNDLVVMGKKFKINKENFDIKYDNHAVWNCNPTGETSILYDLDHKRHIHLSVGEVM